MILNNLTPIGQQTPINIGITNGVITDLSPFALDNADDSLELTFQRSIVFPGLINSHDHLDFNLFPLLGGKTYNNYTEWGKHIHETYKEEIAKTLKIPVSLRSRWGLYKNLLCGVTTVVNHGELSGMEDDLVTVFEKCQCLHSVQFEKRWQLKLNNPLKAALPVAIHIGEGSDWPAFHEIDKLIRWNLLGKKLIGIHAVIMAENQAKKFRALVWCPESNYFLLNKTAPVNLLKKYSSILFGTDSTLTGSWDIWEHLRFARDTRLLDDETLYQTLNHNAANVWQLNSGEISPGKNADLVIAKMKHGNAGYNGFFELGPADLQMVIHQGNIRLFDESLLAPLTEAGLRNFSKIYIGGACKYVQGDLPLLMKKIREYDPQATFPVSFN